MSHPSSVWVRRMGRHFLLWSLWVSIGSAQATDDVFVPTIGDALVTASIGEPSNLIPILASDTASSEISGLIFNGLVKYDRDLQLVGDLAERWEIRKGGLEIDFFLKPGVRWHDGTPLTAHDVVFTFQCLKNPQIPTPYSGDFEKVQSLEVLDERTVRVHYQEPFAPALSSWGMGILPQHLLSGQDLTTTPFKAHPIGTGPYRFGQWIRGDQITLIANPDYFEGRPYIQRYIFRIIPDSSTIFLEMVTSGVDLAGLTPLQFEKLTQHPRFSEQFQKFRYPSFGYTYLGYNLKDPKFQDLRVRQAINLAIDKEEIIQGVLFGLGKAATGPFPQESWAYNPDVQSLSYDPIQARKLLKEAGWEDTNGDGILDREGIAFEFTILTNQGNTMRELTAQIIQKRLEKVGIRVKVWILEWSAFLHEFIDKRRFEAVILGWSLARDPDPYDIWHSSKTKEGEFNFIGYANPRVDALLEQGRRHFDLTTRQKIYREIHQILYQEQPVCFLYVPEALPAIHKRFEGVEVSPIGIGFNLIHWFVPSVRQKYRFLS